MDLLIAQLFFLQCGSDVGIEQDVVDGLDKIIFCAYFDTMGDGFHVIHAGHNNNRQMV